MRKASVSVLVLLVLFTLLSVPFVVSAKGKTGLGSDPLATLYAHPDFIRKGKATIRPALAGISPTQFRKAYGISLVTQKGKGITIAIVDACGNVGAEKDLNKYDTTFGLPATTIKVVKPQGTTCSDPQGWGVETDLDIQMAHAAAPGAKIVLEAARSTSFADLLGAAKDAYTKRGATVVSMSFSGGEFSGETGASTDGVFSTGTGRGVSFTASSGDNGCGAQYPAASPFVTSVGGTSLTIRSNGTYVSESAWSGSGGGFSSFESRPSYQNGFNGRSQRSIPDVAMVADPNTGVTIYDKQVDGFIVVGGTSVAAPLWAGVLALANSGRSGTMGNDNNELYEIASNATKYANDYHDVTTGSADGSCTAGTGYEQVTGLGTPVSNTLVPDLIAAP